MPNPISARVWSWLTALSLLWGGSFVFVGVAVAELPPFTIVLARVGLAALALWAVLLAWGHAPPRSLGVWAAFAVMGALNNLVPFSLIVWGQTEIGAGLAAILNATTPIFTLLVAHLLTSDERLTAPKIAGVALGFAGVTVLIGWEALSGLGASVLAQLAILGAALSYAFAAVYGRRFRAMGMDPATTAAGQVTASTLLVLPLAVWLDRPWTLPMPSLATWVSVLGLAVLSTAVAYVLYFRILAAAGATVLLLVTFLIPPSAIVLGWVVLGETFERHHAAGLALIAAGLLVIDGRARALRR